MVYSFCSNGTSSRSTRGPYIINVHSSTQGYIAFRLYVIWDQRNPVKLILRTALAITYIPVFIIGGICIVTFYSLFLVFFYSCCWSLWLTGMISPRWNRTHDIRSRFQQLCRDAREYYRQGRLCMHGEDSSILCFLDISVLQFHSIKFNVILFPSFQSLIDNLLPVL